MSRSRRSPSEEERDEACQRRAPISDWFTEGFNTADLEDTKALVEELS